MIASAFADNFIRFPKEQSKLANVEKLWKRVLEIK